MVERTVDVLLDFSGLSWGELVEKRGARPYRPSTEVLTVASQYR